MRWFCIQTIIPLEELEIPPLIEYTVSLKSPSQTLSGEIKLCRESPYVQASTSRIDERRIRPRIHEPFPTRAWGKDAEGQNFDVDCELDNISSTGLYLRLPMRVKSDAELSLVIKFLNRQGTGATALLNCRILRGEPQPDGRYGIAMTITEHHFL
jgi:PilZ domain